MRIKLPKNKLLDHIDNGQIIDIAGELFLVTAEEEGNKRTIVSLRSFTLATLPSISIVDKEYDPLLTLTRV